MLKQVVLLCAMTATLCADSSTKDGHDTVISLGPSSSFLKAREARHGNDRTAAAKIAKLFNPENNNTNKMGASDTARLGALFGGAAAGTTLGLFLKSRAKTIGLPLGLAAVYLIMGGKLPGHSQLEGLDELYVLIKILEKLPPQKQVTQLRSLLSMPDFAAKVHFSSLLGQFCNEAEDLLAQKEISKQEMSDQLKQLIASYRGKIKSLTHTVEMIYLFLIATTASASLTLLSGEKATE